MRIDCKKYSKFSSLLTAKTNSLSKTRPENKKKTRAGMRGDQLLYHFPEKGTPRVMGSAARGEKKNEKEGTKRRSLKIFERRQQ